MARGSKPSTSKQRRTATKIGSSAMKRGVSKKRAKDVDDATVKARVGKKIGSKVGSKSRNGRGKTRSTASSKRGRKTGRG